MGALELCSVSDGLGEFVAWGFGSGVESASPCECERVMRDSRQNVSSRAFAIVVTEGFRFFGLHCPKQLII